MPPRSALAAESSSVVPASAAALDRPGLDTTDACSAEPQASCVHKVLKAPGEPLAPQTLDWAEWRFGHNFGSVRLHTGTDAQQSSANLDALAWTYGDRVAIGTAGFSSRNRKGRALLAHEFTHVVQQRSACGTQDGIEVGSSHDTYEEEANSQPRRVHGQLNRPRLQRVSFFQKVWRFFGGEGTFEDAELQEYLKYLDDKKHIEDNFDSDNKAREVVRRWQKGRSGYDLSVERRVLVLKEMIDGAVLEDDERGIIAVLQGSTHAELTAIFKGVTPAQLRKDISDENRIEFDYVITQYNERSPDILSKTKPATPTQHLVTEAALNPGSKLEEAPPPPPPKKVEPPPAPKAEAKPEGKGEAAPKKEDDAAPPPAPKKEPPPPPIFKDASAMTGLGVGGNFEKGMVDALKKYLQTRGSDFRERKKAGKGFPVAKALPIAKSAQYATEDYFGPWLQVASRAPADIYHPRAYSLMNDVHDQSEVPIADENNTAHPSRLGWVRYWMAQENSGGKAVLDKFKCVTTRSPDKEEFARVARLVVQDAALKPDIDDTIHGWPAEATAGVNLQPYQDVSNTTLERRVRWDTYTTLLHEMMHILAHPNYKRTYSLFQGSAQEILKEGMADVMRRDLWFGPGQLKARVSTPAYSSTREQVEGKKFDYDESVVVYHNDYPLEKDARKIVEGDGKHPGVGMPNAKAAFFMGHTDLLGIGEGTRGVAGLAGIANNRASDDKDAEVLIAKAGDTFESIRERAGAGPAGIIDEASGKPLKAGDAIAAGMRLRIPGIRFVPSIEEDTLGKVADQNGVTVEALAIANELGSETEKDFKFGSGLRLLIPIHRSVP